MSRSRKHTGAGPKKSLPREAVIVPDNTGLRAKLLRGGLLFSIREAVGIALSIIGLLVVTRLLGPASYGSYATAFGIHQFVLSLGQVGIEVYLIR